MNLAEKYNYIAGNLGHSSILNVLKKEGIITIEMQKKLSSLFNSDWFPSPTTGKIIGDYKANGILYINIMYKLVKKYEAER